ncbi:MAG: hypothetical protein H7196_00390 [candidate division SR1 bacterium]|nr:hypothetical protein [candidate division SR1 bacterium]
MKKNTTKNLSLSLAIITLGIGSFLTLYNVLDSISIKPKIINPVSEIVVSQENQSSNLGPKIEDYKDGTYTSITKYKVPGSLNEMELTITVSKNEVADINMISKYSDEASSVYDNELKANYKKLSIGKRLDKVPEIQIAGSTPTSDAFDNAAYNILQKALQK